MHSTRIQTLVAAALIAARSLCAAASTFAGAVPGGPLSGFGHDLLWQERMASELGLDDAQQSAIEQISNQTRADAKPFIKVMFEQHKTMRALADAATFDEAAVRAQAAKTNAAMTELAVIHARSALAIRQLLTPAQREQMQQMHQHHRRPE